MRLDLFHDLPGVFRRRLEDYEIVTSGYMAEGAQESGVEPLLRSPETDGSQRMFPISANSPESETTVIPCFIR